MKRLVAIAALWLSALACAQTTPCDSIENCQEALTGIHFRLGELFFEKRDYLTSANEFQAALQGASQLKWVEVWAHINRGKIFDQTGQRERALKEYRMAQRVGDDTRGAQAEAAKYIKTPYRRN